LAFIHSDVRFVIADNENFPGCAMIDGAYLGGDGQTMLQWLNTYGFLEQVCRCVVTRIKIRIALRAWGLAR
jgi:hypothetical protein